MRTNIIRIGNSQGIRIPKVLLEQSRLGTEVELEVESQTIIIRPVSRPRQGWNERFAAVTEEKDEVMLEAEPIAQTEWDRNEWEW